MTHYNFLKITINNKELVYRTHYYATKKGVVKRLNKLNMYWEACEWYIMAYMLSYEDALDLEIIRNKIAHAFNNFTNFSGRAGLTGREKNILYNIVLPEYLNYVEYTTLVAY